MPCGQMEHGSHESNEISCPDFGLHSLLYQLLLLARSSQSWAAMPRRIGSALRIKSVKVRHEKDASQEGQ
jgi:hypothetical protein